MNQKRLRRMAVPIIVTCIGLANCSGNTTTTPGPTTAFAVLRLNSTDGTPDPTFAGGRSIAVTDIDPALFDFALAVAVQPADNFILAGGSSGFAGQGVIALARYNQDGVLDTTGFGTAGTGGIVRTPTPAGWTSASATAIAVQPGGKILVAALAFNATTSNTGIALLRYNANGTPDTNFGTNGIANPVATIGRGLAEDTCALALQGANIIVAGASSDGNVFLSRYDTNGALDTTFGTGGTGVTKTSIGATAVSPALAFQSTGNIIVVSGNSSDQVVLRYTANGTLDATFNASGTTPGIVTTDTGGIDFANAVAVLFDDRIIVVGHANVNFNADASDISLARYTVDGALDTTFGSGGIVTTDLGLKFDNAFSVALQTPLAATTNILVSGNTGSAGLSQIAVLRYTAAGALDPTFGGSGSVIVNLAGPSNIASGNAVVMQPNVGIVVAGYD